MSTDTQIRALRLPGDDGTSNPDRSRQYEDSDPRKLKDQLNEAWRQMRLFTRAVADRDAVINSLHASIHQRDKSIGLLQKSLRLANRTWPLIYAAVGAAAAKLAELGIQALFHHAK